MKLENKDGHEGPVVEDVVLNAQRRRVAPVWERKFLHDRTDYDEKDLERAIKSSKQMFEELEAQAELPEFPACDCGREFVLPDGWKLVRDAPM